MQGIYDRFAGSSATLFARTAVLLGAGVLALWIACGQAYGQPAGPVTLVRDGVARMRIVAGSVPEPVAELRHYVKEMSGAELEVVEAREPAAGIHVGLAADFPWLEFENVAGLGQEGFILKSDDSGPSLYLVANKPLGVQHAVTTLLHRLGCRWFFPGKEWEIIPEHKTLQGV